MSNASSKTFKAGVVLNDKWEIVEFLGKGGMGEVYRANQLNLNRNVAIKVISQEWVKSLGEDTKAITSSLERFRREVQVMAQVHHPNVLQIHDYGSVNVNEGDPDSPIEYIALEYVQGGTLRSTMSNEGFYPDENLSRQWISTYFLPILDGARAIHEAGTIHRDLKPENILLDDNAPKIADFGLARSFRFAPLTQSFEIQGTPPYMSPEHFLDPKETDERTDVYSLGKMLFEAIAGRMGHNQIPFKKACLDNPESHFFQGLDRIIQEATTEDREARTASAAALKKAIEEALGLSESVPPPLPNIAGGKARTWRVAFFATVFACVLSTASALGIAFVHHRAHNTASPIPAQSTETASSAGIFERQDATGELSAQVQSPDSYEVQSSESGTTQVGDVDREIAARPEEMRSASSNGESSISGRDENTPALTPEGENGSSASNRIEQTASLPGKPDIKSGNRISQAQKIHAKIPGHLKARKRNRTLAKSENTNMAPESPRNVFTAIKDAFVSLKSNVAAIPSRAFRAGSEPPPTAVEAPKSSKPGGGC